MPVGDFIQIGGGREEVTRGSVRGRQSDRDFEVTCDAGFG